MRLKLAISLLVLFCGCDKQVHGTSKLYAFNGTEERVDLKLQGRTPIDVQLRPSAGKLFEVIAGPYQISATKRGSLPEMLGAELARDHLTIINPGGVACFARADVAGMYNKNKAPVRLLETYRKNFVFTIRDEIAILPEQDMPASRPKNTFTFQRVALIPCDVDEDWSVEDYIQRLR